MPKLEPLSFGLDAVENKQTITALHNILAGQGSFIPIPQYDQAIAHNLCHHLGAGEDIDSQVALVVATSGSTGIPKGAMLTSSAIHAAIDSSAQALGSGVWLLAIPGYHIAGLLVQLRSLAAGYLPGRMDLRSGFTAEGFIAAAQTLNHSVERFVSLVPAQVHTLLQNRQATEVLAQFSGVLIGGAATSDAIKEKLRHLGVKAHYSYGMSETCGGVVYDGKPLAGVKIRLEHARVALGGATIAIGYRNFPNHEAFASPGWFLSDDYGSLDEGKLTILGRVDDAVNIAGVTVHLGVVEQALTSHPGVNHAAVLALPDEKWGNTVVAAVVADPGIPVDAGELSDWAMNLLGSYARIHKIVFVPELPRIGPGKIDRHTIRQLF